ncbi:MAG TPA: Fur family transcriptional regulator [Methylomirabilota bacterium]|nr:Fur family transcriptional regulator [Methylomirabilota bacterium]
MIEHDDHDHQGCRHSALARAEARCDELGLRLTAQRRRVLHALTASHIPMSAYEIMDRLGEGERRPSPISVYRALDFLVANRFAHRIESRNAFLACVHDHTDPAETAGEPALVFLLCETCGAAAEAEPPALPSLLSGIAEETGFTVRSSVFEIRGTCARCRAAGLAPSPPSAQLPSGDPA